jgi:hypothetical protein
MAGAQVDYLDSTAESNQLTVGRADLRVANVDLGLVAAADHRRKIIRR